MTRSSSARVRRVSTRNKESIRDKLKAPRMNRFCNDLGTILMGVIPFSRNLEASVNSFMANERLGSFVGNVKNGEVNYVVLLTKRGCGTFDRAWGKNKTPHANIKRSDIEANIELDHVQVIKATVTQ